jgi:hypothetical protein
MPVRSRPVMAASAGVAHDFSYVGRDLRRIGIMAASLVTLEILLWYLVAHSALGPAIYRLLAV